MYKLTLPDSMRRVHPVFHVSVLQKHHPDPIEQQHQKTPALVEVNRDAEWEVEEILDCRKRGKRRE
jgi:hypothetical protein